MGQAAARVRITPEEYLALERSSEVRHEYADGEIFAMAGATREHNLTAGNLYVELSLALRDRPCEVYTSDMRIKVSPAGRYVYPETLQGKIKDEPDDQTHPWADLMGALRYLVTGLAKKLNLSRLHDPAVRPTLEPEYHGYGTVRR